MNFNNSNKNYSGLAFVAVLHLAVAGWIVTHSKISIIRPDDGGVIVLKPEQIPPTPPKEEPLENPDIARPKLAITPKPSFEPDWPVLPTITTERGDPPTIIEPGPTGRGKEPAVDVEPPSKAAPVNVAAVIDAASCAKPAYPAAALRNGDEGTVTLAFLVGKDGRVASAKVERTSGNRDLDRAALQGLSMCAFKPGTVDGVAQETWARMQYAWRLDE
jgi:protein TonB